MGKCLICIQLAFVCKPVASIVISIVLAAVVVALNNEQSNGRYNTVGLSQYLNEQFPNTMKLKHGTAEQSKAQHKNMQVCS